MQIRYNAIRSIVQTSRISTFLHFVLLFLLTLNTVAVAYRNVESLGLFGYEHKVFNLKRAPPLVLTIFLLSISGLEELQSYSKFIPQVLWLKILQQCKRRIIPVKQSGF